MEEGNLMDPHNVKINNKVGAVGGHYKGKYFY